MLIHVVSLGLDHYVGFGLADLTVPLHSQWKPVPLADAATA